MEHEHLARRRALAVVALLVTACGPVAVAQSGAGPDTLFEYRGRAYGSADLSIKLQRMVHDVESERHAALVELADEAVFEQYLERQAAATGLMRGEVAARALRFDEPTAAEVEAFYADNVTRIDGSLESVRDDIVRHLRGQRLQRRKDALVASLKAKGGFRLVVEPPPPPPVALDLSGHPVRGRADAPMTIVEFGDYQCPRCRGAVALLRRVLEQYPDDVRLVYLDFPVNRSGISRRVAEGAVCAEGEGQFWAYHDLAFERQSSLDADSPARLAEALGLDAAAFARCLEDGGARARVGHGERQARALGITATPAIYLDGHPLHTLHLERTLVERIEARRAR